MKRRRRLGIAGGVLGLAVGLWFAQCRLEAGGTATWEMSTYRDFLAGRFSGLSLSRDGRVMPAPKAETLFASDQPIIWSIVQGPDGTIYAGTGHRGRVFRIDKSGKASLLWTADQPEVFALALDGKGRLYAATSPDGKIYRIESGKATEYFAPSVRYIWSLAFDREGVLYAGTGDQGKIYRVESPGSGEVYYDTGQGHVTCLGFDSAGRLLAGTEPNGILYRVSAKDRAFVLYDASLPEIRSMVTAPDGAIYAAALGGSMTRRALGGVASGLGMPSSASVSATATSITVEAQQGGVEIKPKPEAAKPAGQAAVATVAAPVLDVSGVEKSAIYRIAPDNTVESLWSSKEENVYDIALSGPQVLFSTDGQGRIYRLGADRKVSLLTQTNEGEAVRLLVTAAGLVAATGDMGKLYRLAEQPSLSGVYESPVHDAGTVARWGRLSWRGENLGKERLVFRTRCGNSLRPDKTWSDWSQPLADANGSAVASPNARYIQWKAEFSGSPAGGPVLDSVTLAYLPQNNPPVLRSINVITQVSTPGAAAKPAATPPAAAAYSITVTDTGETAPPPSAGTPTQALSRSASEQIQITWQAEDPDNDRMVYSLYFRGEGEREWKLLKGNLNENMYAVDADALADGKYYFRVTASDSPVNPPSAAREAELISAPTLIDHTPPQVTAGMLTRSGSRLEVEFEAVDAASPLRRAEYAVDAGLWIPLASEDGIIDSQRERFLVRVENLSPGEHLIVIRVTDSANNAGLAKVVVR